jgi:hypothetical protein
MQLVCVLCICYGAFNEGLAHGKAHSAVWKVETLKLEEVCPSETLVSTCQSQCCHNSEERNINLHSYDDLEFIIRFST